MARTWFKHPFRLLLYLEWVLLGIALIGAFSFVVPHPRHRFMTHPAGFNLAGIVCIAVLGLMGLWLPRNKQFWQQVYILAGFVLSWLAIALISRGERVFPALLLIVVIRACLLFSWWGRVVVALSAFGSFLTLQVMELMRVSLFGVPLGRPLPGALRRLPPAELRRVWFGWMFNSALLFAFVLAFVLLLVGAVLAENKSKSKLIEAHRRLRNYAAKIEDQATLEERNRIAREIHDSVGHYLTAQSIQLENTSLFMAADPAKANDHLAKARDLGKEALSNIRNSVATLRNSPCPDTPIKQLVADFKSHSDLEICDRIDLPHPLTQEIKISLLRIVQEALTNITKHSSATKVDLDLNTTPHQVFLTIQDNGIGFDPSVNTTGFGLQSMSERTAALNGTLEITSDCDQGTQIKIKIPLSTGDK
ncbi:MAG: sensor histidine kinase [Cyanobacteria bacterium J06631_2]